MELEVASLLVRQHFALAHEGIGPRGKKQLEDGLLLEKASSLFFCAEQARLAHGITIHDLWDYHLLPDYLHKRECEKEYCRR